MIDHVRHLLIGRSPDGASLASDYATDAVLSSLGVLKASGAAEVMVDALLPLALAPDLEEFRALFDARRTPATPGSVYSTEYSVEGVDVSLNEVHSKVFGEEGWFTTAQLFQTQNLALLPTLSRLREAAMTRDSAYALGAVLIACAYRRMLLEKGERV